MFSKDKGTFGYLKRQSVRIGILSLILIGFSAFIFAFGYIKTHDAKNLFTLLAVLGMLPGSKYIVSFIMQMKAEKYTCDKALYEKCEEIFKKSDFVRGYDFYLTSYKVNYPVPVCLVCDKSVICLLTDKKDTASLNEHVNKYLASNGIEGYKTYSFDDEEKFIRRITEVCSKFEPTDKDYEALNLMKNLSL